MTGEMFAADRSDEHVSYMLDLLGLNVKSLRELRKAELERVFDEDFLATATVNELQRVAMAFRQPESDGRCLHLGHVIARHAEQLLDSMRAAPLPVAA
jgi:hypothetical protein